MILDVVGTWDMRHGTWDMGLVSASAILISRQVCILGYVGSLEIGRFTIYLEGVYKGILGDSNSVELSVAFPMIQRGK
jgi:hypothetical protein